MSIGDDMLNRYVWVLWVLAYSGFLMAEEQEVEESYLDKTQQVGRVIIGPQPKKADFAELEEQGVRAVINMRRPSEMEELPFLQDYLTQKHNMSYNRVPIGGTDDAYSPVKLAAFAQAIQQSSDEKVLIHCASGYRASQLYAAYLVAYENMSPNAALKLVDPSWWPMPMEKLLGKKLSLTIEEK
ncbi:dual specificity protein phosphatase family protein [Marinicella sp. W31]|uniref:dual specificity protein phosphatase family protein n=1 Tax=Marinicella sp. W31 TaxID=3023713 RepID=UPI003756FE7C